MIVVDASALLEVLLRTKAGEAVQQRILDPRETLHAPHVIDVEITQVLRRYAARREIDSERGRGALADLAAFPLRRYSHTLFLNRIWELRENFTAYDAAYIALTEALDATLVTRDRPLVAACTSFIRTEVV